MNVLIDPEHKIVDANNNVLGSRVCYFYEEPIDVKEPLFFVVDTRMSFDNKDPAFFYYDDNEHVIKERAEEDVLPKASPVDITQNTMEQMINQMVQKRLRELTANTA
jgi:hypothetical protein